MVSKTKKHKVIVDVKDDLKKLEKLNDKRAKILKEVDELWLNKCEPCNLINEAKGRGEFNKSYTKTTKNPICDACPVHARIEKLGRDMDKNLGAIRKKRAAIKKKYGE